jgi:hypothetical protein
MGVFSVANTNQTNDAVVRKTILEHFPNDYYELGRGQWFVAFNGTAEELYKKLFPSNLSGTVVFGIGGYFGFTSRAFWEWLATKLGGKIA